MSSIKLSNLNFKHHKSERFYDTYEAIHHFVYAIRAVGLEPPRHIEPGRFHRFPGLGKQGANRAAWCKLFPDCRAGVFGDWSSGLNQVWKFAPSKPVTIINAEADDKVKQLRTAATSEQIARQEDAARIGRRLWGMAKPGDPMHPYLANKGVRPFMARQLGERLVLPISDVWGRLTSLQFINPDGTKRMLTGGIKKARIIPVRWLGGNAPIVVCEGFATSATLAELLPERSVLAALDAGNLLPACTSLRSRFPMAAIAIYGDDDRLTAGNPGRTMANNAARSCGAKVAFPPWACDIDPPGSTDFNDWALPRGFLAKAVANASK